MVSSVLCKGRGIDRLQEAKDEGLLIVDLGSLVFHFKCLGLTFGRRWNVDARVDG